jgi:hypothetical protein
MTVLNLQNYPIESFKTTSWVTYLGTGTTTTWPLTSIDGVPIEYLHPSHINVYLDRVKLTQGVGYHFDTSGRNIIIDPAIPNQAELHINRNTPTEPLVDFTAASIWRTTDLDTATLQSIFIALEGLDYLLGIQRGHIAVGDADTLDGLDSSSFLQLATSQTATGYKAFASGIAVAYSLGLPTWTNSTRPIAPGEGVFGYNTQLYRLEFWSGSEWLYLLYSGDYSYLVSSINPQTIGGHKTFTDGLTAIKSLNLPIWTTATRPAMPTVGLVGFNSSLASVEFWNGTQWAFFDLQGLVTLTGAQTIDGFKTFGGGAQISSWMAIPQESNPAAPTAGRLRYNVDTNAAEVGAKQSNDVVIWQPLTGHCNPNLMLNGSASIWQRGTTFNNPANGAYTADRWRTLYDGTGLTRQISYGSDLVNGTTFPSWAHNQDESPTNWIRWYQSGTASGSTYNILRHVSPGITAFPAETDLTLTVLMRATVAPFSGSISISQIFGAGGSAQVSTDIPITVPLNAQTKIVKTFRLPSLANKIIGTDSHIAVDINMPLSGTFSLDIANFKIERGPVSTHSVIPSHNEIEYARELAACKRFYNPDIQLVPLYGYGAAADVPLAAAMTWPTMAKVPTITGATWLTSYNSKQEEIVYITDSGAQAQCLAVGTGPVYTLLSGVKLSAELP